MDNSYSQLTTSLVTNHALIAENFNIQNGRVGSNAFHMTDHQIQMAQQQNTSRSRGPASASRTAGGSSSSSSISGNELSIGGVRIGGGQGRRGGNQMAQDVSDEGVQETLR